LKKIRILNVTFDTEIKGYEVPAFRGAIINKVGIENTLFHNHLGETDFRFKYPLIQYKQINRRPAILCIDHGVDEIHKFFEKRDWSLEISGRTLEMKIDQLQMNQFTMQVWDSLNDYRIYKWAALNQDNYLKYMQLDSMADKLKMLESLLKANILSFAKGIDWTVDKQIDVIIKELLHVGPVKLKGQNVLGFDVAFRTNVFLPNHIGLGKSASTGFGVVHTEKR
jgi:hypothetical protein